MAAITRGGCTGDIQGGWTSGKNGFRALPAARVASAQGIVVYLDA
jgi:hypothetical protein